MRFVTITPTGREEVELFVTGVTAGRSCDEITLEVADFCRLRELPPEVLHEWVKFMLLKFRPAPEQVYGQEAGIAFGELHGQREDELFMAKYQHVKVGFGDLTLTDKDSL